MSFLKELSEHYFLTTEQIQRYQDEGYIKLKAVFSGELLEHYGQIITEAVMSLYSPSAEKHPNSTSETYEKAFRQTMNIWRGNDRVKEFVFSKRLSAIASELMRVDNVRLYHDQALYKMENGGITPWHADQYYWPLSSNNTTTVWMPLQAVAQEMAPLSFAAGSQNVDLNRDQPISDEGERLIQEAMSDSDFKYDSTPYDLGEVSFHSGWTMHNAGENKTNSPRKVMTVIYMEDGIKLIEPQNENQKVDWETWLPGAEIGKVIDTELNPVL
jgi:ectoine hydroxylase-related dioxygenase (phytanoyl-CoA dioxygenase family)